MGSNSTLNLIDLYTFHLETESQKTRLNEKQNMHVRIYPTSNMHMYLPMVRDQIIHDTDLDGSCRSIRPHWRRTHPQSYANRTAPGEHDQQQPDWCSQMIVS